LLNSAFHKFLKPIIQTTMKNPTDTFNPDSSSNDSLNAEEQHLEAELRQAYQAHSQMLSSSQHGALINTLSTKLQTGQTPIFRAGQ